MRPLALLLLLAAPPDVHGAHVPATWRAPPRTATNNLTLALHGAGTNGFIYNSSTTAAAYNYCNMPRVHAGTYAEPDAGRYELRYVEVIHRHHKRTPYQSNTFPAEDTGWDCTGAEQRTYAGAGIDGGQGARVGRVRVDLYAPMQNPFRTTGYHPTNCAFPQLSQGGLHDALGHGRDLRAVYGDRLRFLPRAFDPAHVAFRVTNNEITAQVLGALAAGLFPALADAPVPALLQPAAIDSLEPAYACPAADQLRSAYTTQNATWQQHLQQSAPLWAKLDALSGVDPADGGWHASWDHYFDALTSRTCHGVPLPCNATAGACITPADMETVARLGQWEYSFYGRDAPQSLPYAALRFGVWLQELNSHLAAAAASSAGFRYLHNVAHDGSVSVLLAALQVDRMVWPGMGAEVVFELWRDKTKAQWVLRVLWGGKVLHSSAFGPMDMVPLDDFSAYIEELVGSNVVSACRS